MSRIVCSVGFKYLDPDSPKGVTEYLVEEKKYPAELKRNRVNTTQQGINQDITLNNVVSILFRQNGNFNVGTIIYVELHKVKWLVSNREIIDNRVELSLGGLYKGE